MNWETVYHSEKAGGLGIKSLILMNRILLAKWIMTICGETIDIKCGYECDNWWTWEVKGTHGVGVWKAIMGEHDEVRKDCLLQVGNGEGLDSGLICGVGIIH